MNGGGKAGDPGPGEKLQKILAARGLGSRRKVEEWIAVGRLKINGKTAKLGDRARPDDRLELDGRLIADTDSAQRVILYHKPEGEVSTRRDEKGRATVFDRLPKLRGKRWVAVGRLDIQTTGLLLFTTDGALANKLMHPSSQIDREYLVRVFGDVSDAVIQKLRDGVELEDGLARFSDITENENNRGEAGQNNWYTVCLTEGRNREVRRLWESQSIQVSRLKRVRYGPVLLPSFLRQGEWAELDMASTKLLYRSAGLAVPALNLKKPMERVKARRQEQKARAGGRRTQRKGRQSAG